jgi:hypothetical protein
MRFGDLRPSLGNLVGLSLVISGIRPLFDDSSIRNLKTLHLSDFDLEQAWRFAAGLPHQSHQTLNDIFRWTDGHPYLTQRACLEVLKRQSESLPVDRILQDYFVNRNSHDPNLEYLSRALTEPGESFLREYQKVISGSSNIDKNTIEYLTQIGLLKTAGPLPQIRNRIYREVFSEKWVELKLRGKAAPDDLFNGRDLSADGFTVDEHYRLIRLLGQGRAGNVYLAEDHWPASDDVEPDYVAVRVIPSNYLLSESHSKDETFSYFQRILREVARLDHENIINIIDSGFSDESYFYVVTQYVSGASLTRFIGHSGRLRPEQSFEILRQIVEAIAAAHDAGVLHGDLTPFKIFCQRR